MLTVGAFVCLLAFVCSSWASIVNQPESAVTESCQNLAAWGKCEFYTCVESRFPCGADGFILKYGKYFCDKVDSRFSDLDAGGQRYMNLTSVCLTSSLRGIYEQESTTCGAIKDAGVNNIINCQAIRHNDMDFCDFAGNNSRVYMEVFTPSDFPRMMLLDRRLTYSFFVEAVRCGGLSFRQAISRLGNQIGTSVTSFFAALMWPWSS